VKQLFACRLGRLVAGAAALLSMVAWAGAAETAPAASPAPWKLLFSSRGDLHDTWGLLQIGVTPVRQLGEFQPPSFVVIGGFPRGDGVWEVFGQQRTEQRGGDHSKRQNTWKLLRATTRDGTTFADVQTVYESESAAWTEHTALAYHSDAHEYLLLKLKADDSGFGYSAFFSADGLHWREHAGNPLFYDGDAMSLFYSPTLHRYVCINKSLQPFRKHLPDHGGATPSLGDDSLRDRRVLMLRTSGDGRRWEPAVSMTDVWNRHGKKGAIPAEHFLIPDAADPPELEFYSGNAFWYHDRAYMQVLNYAASPLLPRKHGPQLDNEWWTSPDGVHWERPARGINSLEVFPRVPRLETHPLVVNGRILFLRGRMLLGIPEDRISCVQARANGEFSTAKFAMPSADLVANLSVPSPERPFAKDQAYLMVAVLDEHGQVIPGFEAAKCVIRAVDRPDAPIQWGDRSARELAGRQVQLRFFLRSASLYAVTAKAAP